MRNNLYTRNIITFHRRYHIHSGDNINQSQNKIWTGMDNGNDSITHIQVGCLLDFLYLRQSIPYVSGTQICIKNHTNIRDNSTVSVYLTTPNNAGIACK